MTWFTLRVVNGEDVTTKIRVSVIKLVYTDSSVSNSPSLVIRTSHFLQYGEDAINMGVL